MAVSRQIARFLDGGQVNYSAVMQIPLSDRLPSLVAQDEKAAHAIVTALLTDFCNCFNVVRPMTAEQIVRCAYELMKTSYEDYLALEDLVIFFEGAKVGKFTSRDARVLDRLDMQTVFAMLENYRQARYEEQIRYREEQQAKHKSLGSGERRQSEDIQVAKDLIRHAQMTYLQNQNKQNG